MFIFMYMFIPISVVTKIFEKHVFCSVTKNSENVDFNAILDNS